MDAGNWIRTRMTSLRNPVKQEEPAHIYPSDVNKYFTLRDIEGICRAWQENSKRWIKTYLDYVTRRVDEAKTLSYYKKKRQFINHLLSEANLSD